MDLTLARRKVDAALADHDHALRQVKAEKEALAEAKARREALTEAQHIVQGIAQAVQESAHKRIAAVASRCLRAVFGEDAYELQIRFERKRGKTEARLLFVRDGLEIEEPLDGAGGGAIDVAAFALRLASLVLARPQRRRFLALDEPMKMLSKDYVPAMRELFLALARDMGVQIVLVTHNPGLACGKIVELE